jgi:hypothetical protein
VGRVHVQPLWMDGMGKIVGEVGDKPPQVVRGMVKPLGWKEVSQEPGNIRQGLD